MKKYLIMVLLMVAAGIQGKSLKIHNKIILPDEHMPSVIVTAYSGDPAQLKECKTYTVEYDDMKKINWDCNVVPFGFACTCGPDDLTKLKITLHGGKSEDEVLEIFDFKEDAIYKIYWDKNEDRLEYFVLDE